MLLLDGTKGENADHKGEDASEYHAKLTPHFQKQIVGKGGAAKNHAVTHQTVTEGRMILDGVQNLCGDVRSTGGVCNVSAEEEVKDTGTKSGVAQFFGEKLCQIGEKIS